MVEARKVSARGVLAVKVQRVHGERAARILAAAAAYDADLELGYESADWSAVVDAYLAA